MTKLSPFSDLSATAQMVVARAMCIGTDRSFRDAAEAIIAGAEHYGYLAGCARQGQEPAAEHGHLLYEMCAAARELTCEARHA